MFLTCSMSCLFFFFLTLMLIVIKILWIKKCLCCTGICSLILLNVVFVGLPWIDLLPSGAAAVPKKGRAISRVIACIMLTREKVIWFHIKANIVHVSFLHKTINIILWNDMFLKHVRFIFFQLKNEMLKLPHLKNKIHFLTSPPKHTLLICFYVQMVMMSLVA